MNAVRIDAGGMFDIGVVRAAAAGVDRSTKKRKSA